MIDELKPCPFCGNTSICLLGALGSDERYGYCKNCGAEGPFGCEKIAIEAWNTRPEVTALQAENARLRGELEQIRTIQAASKTIEIVIPEGWGEPGIHLPDTDADTDAHDA